MEIIRPYDPAVYQIKAVIFDFDGTLSTIRYGWVPMMYRMFMKYITDGRPVSDEQKAELKHYTLISGGMGESAPGAYMNSTARSWLKG